MVQNMSDLAHFDHKGGLSHRQVVRGTDAGKNRVDDTDRRAVGRYKRPDLRHQHDQRRLSHIGRFARHIRAGNQRHPVIPLVEQGIVGHERRVEQAFHHGMPPPVMQISPCISTTGQVYFR